MPDKQHAGAFVVPVKDKYQIYAVCGTSFSVHKGFRVKSCSGGPLHIQTITKLSDWKLFLIKNRIIYLFHLWIEITAKSRIELENTRMSRSRNGERTSAVKVLETTVGGFFSGSLNKCWRQEDVLKLRLLDCVNVRFVTPMLTRHVALKPVLWYYLDVWFGYIKRLWLNSSWSLLVHKLQNNVSL